MTLEEVEKILSYGGPRDATARELAESLKAALSSKPKIVLDGITYGPNEIDEVREALVVYRNRAMDNYPQGIEMSLVLSHAIGVLAQVKEIVAK